MASIPASLIAPSRMKLNIVELAERSPNESFKDAVLKSLGDLSSYIVLGGDVLVATYIKPRKTTGGIILSDKGIDEDRWQSKVGLVLKLGEMAYQYAAPHKYTGTTPKEGDYVAFHTSDTREIGIRGVSCRTIDWSLVRMIVPDPDQLY